MPMLCSVAGGSFVGPGLVSFLYTAILLLRGINAEPVRAEPMLKPMLGGMPMLSGKLLGVTKWMDLLLSSFGMNGRDGRGRVALTLVARCLLGLVFKGSFVAFEWDAWLFSYS